MCTIYSATTTRNIQRKIVTLLKNIVKVNSDAPPRRFHTFCWKISFLSIPPSKSYKWYYTPRIQQAVMRGRYFHHPRRNPSRYSLIYEAYMDTCGIRSIGARCWHVKWGRIHRNFLYNFDWNIFCQREEVFCEEMKRHFFFVGKSYISVPFESEGNPCNRMTLFVVHYNTVI